MDIQAVLWEGWQLSGPAEPVTEGVRRKNWRVGEAHYLTAIPRRDARYLDREHRFVRAFHDLAPGSRLRLPTPVETTHGEWTIVVAEWVFRLTQTIDGVAPDYDDPESYEAAARGLAGFHGCLRGLGRGYAVADSGVFDELLRLLDGPEDPRTWEALTDDPEERALVLEAWEIVVARPDVLRGAPRQLVHGDWTFPNLRMTAAAPRRLTGVLDLEAVAWDSVLLDLAQSVSGAVMWSSAEDPWGFIDGALASYETAAECDVAAGDVGWAVAAYWLHNYFWLRRHHATKAELGGALRRQPGRLREAIRVARALA